MVIPKSHLPHNSRKWLKVHQRLQNQFFISRNILKVTVPEIFCIVCWGGAGGFLITVHQNFTGWFEDSWKFSFISSFLSFSDVFPAFSALFFLFSNHLAFRCRQQALKLYCHTLWGDTKPIWRLEILPRVSGTYPAELSIET